jgi:hypothetical protein
MDRQQFTVLLFARCIFQVKADGSRRKRRSQAARSEHSLSDNTGFLTRNVTLQSLPLLAVMLWFTGVYLIQVEMTSTFFSNAASVYTLLQTSLSSLTARQRIIEITEVYFVFVTFLR